MRRGSSRYPVTYYDVSAEGIAPVSGAEANERIDRITAALWADGVRPGDRVALSGKFCMGRCGEGVCVTIDDVTHVIQREEADDFFKREILEKV